MCLGVKLVSDQKKMSKAERGVAEAVKKAEAGELISKAGRKMQPQSLANLKPKTLDQQTPERRKEIQQMGAAASNQVQAKRRTIQEICQTVLAMDLPENVTLSDEDASQIAQKVAEKTGKPVTVYDAIVCAQTAAAMQGNTKAAEYIRDSAGDKPGENVRLDADIMTEGDRKLLAKLQAAMGIDAD